MANDTEEKAMKEAADSIELVDNELPEAPASANISLWIDGFRTQLTVRGFRLKTVIERLEYIVNHAKKSGWVASPVPVSLASPTPGSASKDPKWISDGDDIAVGQEKLCTRCGGTRTLREGIGKNNKPYKGWFCDNEACGMEASDWVRMKR